MAKAIEKVAEGVIKDQKKRYSAEVLKYRQMGPLTSRSTMRPTARRPNAARDDCHVPHRPFHFIG